jgi:hypothetical protein
MFDRSLDPALAFPLPRLRVDASGDSSVEVSRTDGDCAAPVGYANRSSRLPRTTEFGLADDADAASPDRDFDLVAGDAVLNHFDIFCYPHRNEKAETRREK